MCEQELSDHRLKLFILWLGLIALPILACAGSGVSPDDPRLQSPTVNTGLELENFLEWLGLFAVNTIPPPWIVEPPTTHYIDGDSFRVRGWAISAEDRSGGVPQTSPLVTLYEIDAVGYPSVVRELGSQSIEGDNREWVIDQVSLEGDRLFIAAKVSVVMPGGLRRYSDFSNRVTVYRGKPSMPSIESPEDGFETTEETVIVKGAGQAGYDIVLFRNDIEVGSTNVSKDFRWEIRNVTLDIGDNRLVAKIKDTNIQSDGLVVKRQIPQPDFKFPWAEGQTHYWTGGPHSRESGSCGILASTSSFSGLDFAEGGWEVRAAASGEIIFAGWLDEISGKGVKIDHYDGWETWYAHLSEVSPKIIAMVRDKEETGKPQWIPSGTYLGKSGCTGQGAKYNGKCISHLHLELQRHGAPETWVGKVINGWTVHIMSIKDQGTILNYQGSMTQGKESVVGKVNWCSDSGMMLVTTGEKTRVASGNFKSCNQNDPSANNDASAWCNALRSSNDLPENEE